MLNKLYFILPLFAVITSSGQSKNGYWDNIRTTNETIILRAGEKKVIKTADFPEGTTEIVYRITILDDNQKVSSSLVSVLKAIPDPTGISQGAAGAVFLASTISGDDKCKFAIFSEAKEADLFLTTAKNDKACLVQDTPINKEARLLKAKNSACFNSKTQNLYFAFESDNWVMKEKVILEIVPWVDNIASRGWDSDNKKEIITLSKTLKVYPSLTGKESFSVAFLEKIAQKFSYKEFTNLLPIEKSAAIENATEDALKKTGETKKYYCLFRDRAYAAINKGNFEDAITIMQSELIAKNRAESIDYATLGNYYILSKQFDKAEKTLNEAISKDATDINLQLQLAHLYLFTNRVSGAKEIHKKYKEQNVNSKTSWIQQTKIDFELFKKCHLPEDDFKKILRILE
jgi:thioredoxin-like negative regulator of GroEL